MAISVETILGNTGPHEDQVINWIRSIYDHLSSSLETKASHVLCNILYEYKKLVSKDATDYFFYLATGVAEKKEVEYYEFAPIVFKAWNAQFTRDMSRLRHDTIKRVGPSCTFCGSDKTTVLEKQTRSGDEGMTFDVICSNCGRMKRIAG